ncbi:hypothetical protein RF11_04677 [Thelohanellus kitauei]|uniref:Uncharacterized protein n=1 Tax=Thelohanellus kitauei TaxID=669202 RepID=A0A0C2N3Q6_THEKT|nr:hypothetical protein RF11_04677 [Thelohanellus kitauei]
MEVIKTLDDDIVADVIILLPDIFDHSHHDTLAQEFKALLNSNTSISPIIYHVLGCLTLSPLLLNEINDEVMELLMNVPIVESHLIIKFLVKNIDHVYDPDEVLLLSI